MRSLGYCSAAEHSPCILHSHSKQPKFKSQSGHLDTSYGCVSNAQCQKSVFLVCHAECTYFCTKIAINSVFGHLVRAYAQCQKSVFAVAHGTGISLLNTCHQKCLQIPSVGVFDMHNAKNGCFRCGTPNLHLHQRCPGIPSKGVFQFQNAKKCVLLVWFAEHAYLCTNSATKCVF